MSGMERRVFSGGSGSGGSGGSITVQGAVGTNLGATQTINFVGAVGETWLVGTLNANLAITISNQVAGCRAYLLLVEDATGGRTLTVNGAAVSIATTANAFSMVEIKCPDATNIDVAVIAPGGGSGSGLPSNVLTKTANFTASANDFVDADASGGGFTVTLPAAPAVGALVTVKKVDGTANVVSVAAQGGGAIDGDAGGAAISSPNFGAVFEHIGSNAWKVTAVTSAGGANGTNGNTIWNGAGAPSAGTGVNGDFYIDTTAHAIYGPKAAGAWGSSTSLVGPAGSNGTNGAISSVQVNDAAQTVRAALDLKAGTNVTLTPTDNSGAGRTEVVIASTASGGSVAPLDGAIVMPAVANNPSIGSNQTFGTANKLYASRAICPKAGHLRSVSAWIGTAGGNAILAVFDTGDSSAGNRSLLGNSGSQSIASTGWLTWDPGASAIAVTAGQHLDFAILGDTTASAFALPSVRPGTAAAATLPTGFLVAAGGASPKVAWTFTNGSFAAPATVSEANCVAGAFMPFIIAFVS